MKSTLFSDRSESNRPRTTRRRAVAMLAGASTVGLGALALGSDEAAADIELTDELSIADGHYAAEDPAPDLVVGIDARIAYRVGSITDWNISVELGPPGETEFVELESESTNATEAEQTQTLTAPLTDADGFEAADFAPGPETTAEHDLEVVLTLSIMDGGETVVTDEVSDTATVTVENESVDIEASLGGDGEITFE